ncbi:MAG: hypothetical protein WCC32_13120 [Terriglobales bacterium]
MTLLMYFKALGKRLWPLLSCAVFTAIGVYAAATNQSNRWVAWTSLGAAFLLLLVASFLAWRDEHVGYEAEREKNKRAPEIAIEILMLVPKGKAGEKGMDLFMWATLTLKEPREVAVDNFEIEAIREGISISFPGIEDVSRWGRVTHNDQGGYKGFVMQPLRRMLAERGNPVTGWLHFRLELLESQIYDSTLRLKVKTAHGACSKDVNGGLAFPDPKNKGVIREANTGFLKGLGLSLD